LARILQDEILPHPEAQLLLLLVVLEDLSKPDPRVAGELKVPVELKAVAPEFQNSLAEPISLFTMISQLECPDFRGKITCARRLILLSQLVLQRRMSWRSAQ
jgi:hypothetical protein